MASGDIRIDPLVILAARGGNFGGGKRLRLYNIRELRVRYTGNCEFRIALFPRMSFVYATHLRLPDWEYGVTHQPCPVHKRENPSIRGIRARSYFPIFTTIYRRR